MGKGQTGPGNGKWKDIGAFKEACEKYMLKCEEEDDIPTVISWCEYLDVSRETMCQWEKNRPEISDYIKRMKARIFDAKMKLAARGKMNPTVFIFEAVNHHGMINTRSEGKNKNDNTHSGEIKLKVERQVID